MPLCNIVKCTLELMFFLDLSHVFYGGTTQKKVKPATHKWLYVYNAEINALDHIPLTYAV